MSLFLNIVKQSNKKMDNLTLAASDRYIPSRCGTQSNSNPLSSAHYTIWENEYNLRMLDLEMFPLWRKDTYIKRMCKS